MSVTVVGSYIIPAIQIKVSHYKTVGTKCILYQSQLSGKKVSCRVTIWGAEWPIQINYTHFCLGSNINDNYMTVLWIFMNRAANQVNGFLPVPEASRSCCYCTQAKINDQKMFFPGMWKQPLLQWLAKFWRSQFHHPHLRCLLHVQFWSLLCIEWSWFAFSNCQCHLWTNPWNWYCK